MGQYSTGIQELKGLHINPEIQEFNGLYTQESRNLKAYIPRNPGIKMPIYPGIQKFKGLHTQKSRNLKPIYPGIQELKGQYAAGT